jgi:DNA-binding beta-propeller fold protein YncE
MKNTLFFLAIAFLLIYGCKTSQHQINSMVSAPSGDQYCSISTDGITVIPNGRLLEPMGKTVRIAPHPYGLALSKDGKMAVTANSGNRPFSITIVENPLSGSPKTRQVPEGAQNDPNLLEDVFMGLVITSDNQSVWVAGGKSNKLFQYQLASGAKMDSIFCGTSDHPDGYLGDLVLNQKGDMLYVCDQSNFQLLIVDITRHKVVHRVPVGRYPFGITLSPDEKMVYIANVGMFEYKPLEPKNGVRDLSQAPGFPVTVFNSKEMKDGTQTDIVQVPGLGDPNVPESFSVWSIDLSGATPYVKHKVKTGFLIGEKIEGIPAVGGSSPNSLVASSRFVFVSNGNNDCISIIDPQKGRVLQNIFLKPLPQLSRYRGVIPFGLAISPDQSRLYVAESGLNAVAVIDLKPLGNNKPAKVLGHLPVGWFPSKLAVSHDGKKLLVANAKGYGSGPNGGYTFKEGAEGSYIGHLMHGSVTALELPADDKLPYWTQKVLNNNFKVTPTPAFAQKREEKHPIPLYPGERKTPIKYIVFISKENRTYDEVFGQVKKGKGDPEIARYGYERSFSNKAKTQFVEKATIMPNHLSLAKRFGISDNFYVDSDHSADGHRWLVNTYPNEWVETNVAAGYGGHRNVKEKSKEKGKYGWTGSAGAIFPEDYNEAGSMWEHLERNRISFFNWGFGTEMASNLSDSTMRYYGQKVLINYPIPAPLFVHTSTRYPTYNMAIPDQFRADMFIEDFKSNWLNKGITPPQMLTILLPNDHGAGERPQAGYPFRESYMADNDLALGRIIEFLSHTPYWKEMAVFVTEDDAQDGRDHVDAHRSLLMVYSPYAKRNHVSHVHNSFGSIFKTFWNLLGIPYLNQYDAGATDLSDFFTHEPDFSPYKALPVDPRVLDPQQLLTPFDAKFDWKSMLESPKLDDVQDFLKEKSGKQ